MVGLIKVLDSVIRGNKVSIRLIKIIILFVRIQDQLHWVFRLFIEVLDWLKLDVKYSLEPLD